MAARHTVQSFTGHALTRSQFMANLRLSRPRAAVEPCEVQACLKCGDSSFLRTLHGHLICPRCLERHFEGDGSVVRTNWCLCCGEEVFEEGEESSEEEMELEEDGGDGMEIEDDEDDVEGEQMDAEDALLGAVDGENDGDERLTKFQFLEILCNSQAEITAEGTVCGICMEEHTVGTMANFVNACGRHSFDGNCIRSWAVDHNSCPSCRAKLYRRQGYGWAEDANGRPAMYQMDLQNVATLRGIDAYLSKAYGKGYWESGPSDECNGLLAHLLAQRATRFCAGELEVNSANDFVQYQPQASQLELLTSDCVFIVDNDELKRSTVHRFFAGLSAALEDRSADDSPMVAHPLAFAAILQVWHVIRANKGRRLSAAALEKLLCEHLQSCGELYDLSARSSPIGRDSRFPHLMVPEEDIRSDALPVGFDAWVRDLVWGVVRDFVGEEVWTDRTQWRSKRREEFWHSP
ncbi:hypothetical protein BAUCODRAFT_33253 [Baudoinia panamericana UAMH 10762]|uniref:RING-type domain-containing protein n=1 Tax=Baudoinia panamericana (strain UAMH 10762) TaxID=717646 RepID=M2N0U1_BAUPA|nr:uncharacterized protein BAUCODRAFT_33253 [Baudoinia panamericana UAMH 10762]EMC97538.1 hypothetical protein BAUCODRAFT_33253 [Baudoinia panamericana UAMH 10762]